VQLVHNFYSHVAQWRSALQLLSMQLPWPSEWYPGIHSHVNMPFGVTTFCMNFPLSQSVHDSGLNWQD
jgi:hypothetical protein